MLLMSIRGDKNGFWVDVAYVGFPALELLCLILELKVGDGILKDLQWGILKSCKLDVHRFCALLRTSLDFFLPPPIFNLAFLTCGLSSSDEEIIRFRLGLRQPRPSCSGSVVTPSLVLFLVSGLPLSMTLQSGKEILVAYILKNAQDKKDGSFRVTTYFENVTSRKKKSRRYGDLIFSLP